MKDAALSTTSHTPLPAVFLAYQQRLMTAIDEHSVVGIEKSRRTGYSWALGAVASLTASASRAAGGMDVLYMGYEKEMTREFIDYVADWAKHFQHAASAMEEFIWTDPDHPELQIQAFRIRFDSGYEVVALPSVPRALRGKQGLVILDEAAFMDDLEAVLKAALALLIWGGKVVVCSTHDGEMNPFNTLIQDGRSGRKPYHILRCTFDDALADGLYKRICLVRGLTWSPEAEAKWRAEIIAQYAGNEDEELHVIPNPTSGVFLPGPLIEARQVPDVPVLRWTAPKGFALWKQHLREEAARDWMRDNLDPVLETLPDEPYTFGTDIARRGDLWVNCLLGLGRDLVRRTRLMIELRDIPFEQQRQILWHLLDDLRDRERLRRGCMDATGLGMQISEETMQRYGETIVEMVMLNEPWYREKMPALKAAFEDAMITIPQDRDVSDDLRMLKLVRGVARIPERRLNAEGERRHGDAAIAYALAYAASRADPEIYGYTAGRNHHTPRREDGWNDRSRADEDDMIEPGRSWMLDRVGGAFG